MQPCRHEGNVLDRCHTCPAAAEGKHVRECDVHERCTRAYVSDRVRSCDRCGDFAPEPPPAPPGPAAPAGAGLCVGTYGLPELARLQLVLARETCGAVPVLFADDGSGRDAEFEAVCEASPPAEFWPSDGRRGHYAGDASAFWKAIQWGSVRGLDYVCKLSQRFLWTRPGWLADAVAGLRESGEATMMQACTDKGVDLKARTECVLLKVADWLPLFKEFDVHGLGNPTELHFWHRVHAHFGGRFREWKGLPADRYQPAAGTVWHASHAAADFHAAANARGVTLPPDFSVAGWDRLPNWVRG